MGFSRLRGDLLLALMFSGCFGAGQVWAGEAEQVLGLLPLSLEELFATKVITASRRAESREQTPAHILVITGEQIRDRRYKNLADLLEDLPGVDFMRGTKSSLYNNFSFQGQSSSIKLIIMLDGVRIDHPAGGRVPVASNYSLHFAKQVEVLYGPAAALYGADAMAGVINIITERAEGAPSATVRVGRGSFDASDDSLLASLPFGDAISMTVGIDRERTGTARLNQYYPGAFPKVDAKTFTGTKVISAAQREDYTGGPVGGESDYLRLDFGRDATFGYYRNGFHNPTSVGDTSKSAIYSSAAQYRSQIETWYGKWRFELAPGLSGELVVDQSELKVDPNSRYLNIYTDFQEHGYDYSYGRRRGIEQNLTWQINDRHTLQSGVGIKKYSAIETPDMPQPYNVALGPSGQQYTYPNTNLPLRIFEANYNNTSAYAQWQAQWNADFSTTTGLRYDHHSSYGSTVNPRLGLVWQNVPGSFLKLLYGESFRAPSPDEGLNAYGSFDGSSRNGVYLGQGFRVPNFNLQPEKSRELSLTWDWRARQSFNLIANAYLTQVRNVLVTQNEAVSTQYIPGALLSGTTIKGNNGVDRYYGLDIVPQWRVALSDTWAADLWGSYSFQRGRIRESDGINWDQNYIAGSKLKLGATLRHQDWLTVTARLQSTGAVTTGRKLDASTGSRIESPGYAVASLHVGVHKLADRKLSAYFDIYNLFDRRYYAAHGSASSTFVQVPQQPRSFFASLEYKF
jgi:outer membrane receptor protein involved in Fe transport